ncbi:unknown [Clostridium sp. CAG:967]|nr:unknown [Clostridium sp. CAG:967]
MAIAAVLLDLAELPTATPTALFTAVAFAALPSATLKNCASEFRPIETELVPVALAPLPKAIVYVLDEVVSLPIATELLPEDVIFFPIPKAFEPNVAPLLSEPSKVVLFSNRKTP